MIIDKLPGQPCNSSTASEGKKLKVLGRWASILCTLSKHPLDKIGSLTFDADGAIQVGPVASDRTGTLPCIGPFTDARVFYSTWAFIAPGPRRISNSFLMVNSSPHTRSMRT